MFQQPHIFWFTLNEGGVLSAQCRSQFVLHHIQAKHGFTFDWVQPSWRLDQLIYFLFVFSKILISTSQHPIVIQGGGTRGFFSLLVRLVVRIRPENTYYDIDDAEWIKDSAPHTHFFLRRVSAVVAGNPALAGYAKKYNQQVIVFPTVPLPATQKQRIIQQRFSIGWVRSTGTDAQQQQEDFRGLQELIFSAVIAIAQPVRLVLIGLNSPKQRRETKAFFAPYPHVELLMPSAAETGSTASVLRWMGGVNVAVCPSVDGAFKGFQSAFGAKQFLKMGVPVLASRSAEFPFLIRHEENGFLCDSSADFADYLHLIANKSKEQMEVIRMHCLVSHSPCEERVTRLSYAKLFFAGYNRVLLKGDVRT